MTNPRFIVCEKKGRWAMALRGAQIALRRIYETRKWADCRREVETAPTSLVALELRKDNLPDVVRELLELRSSFPNAGAVVLASWEMEEHEWTLREAGALHVALSPRDLSVLVRVVERFLRQTPARHESLRDAVWERLPWSGGA